MKLPISDSLLAYFDELRQEKAWYQQRRRTEKVKAARKRGQYKKYKHKEGGTAKETIEKYQVILLVIFIDLNQKHQTLVCNTCGIHFSKESQSWMEVHKRICVEKDQHTILTKDLKLPNCFVWIPVLEVPDEHIWEKKGTENVEKYQNIPKAEEEEMDVTLEEGWSVYFFSN